MHRRIGDGIATNKPILCVDADVVFVAKVAGSIFLSLPGIGILLG